MAVRMIGLDLDGTVLTDQKEVTKATRRVIERALQKGITVLPVTGRPIPGIPEAVLDIPGIRYAITSNGAVLYDLQEKRTVIGHYLDCAAARGIVEEAEENDWLYDVFIDGFGYGSIRSHEHLMHFFEGTALAQYIGTSRKGVGDIFSYIESNKDRIENIWVRTNSKEEGDCLEQLIRSRSDSSRLTTLRTMPQDVETVAANADKGRTMEELAARLDIDRKEILAVGDSENDLGLLSAAGISVAMGNASEKVKALADWIAPDNAHDGAAAAIMRYAFT
jgi:Cof subfamily protein (haloacid dehalogenase superfamily)